MRIIVWLSALYPQRFGIEHRLLWRFMYDFCWQYYRLLSLKGFVDLLISFISTSKGLYAAA